VEIIRFVFGEAIKVLALVLLVLIACKSVAALSTLNTWVKRALYILILAMATLGAWFSGNDVAAEVYRLSALSNLSTGDLKRAYLNSLRAVMMRPNKLTNWQALMASKMHLEQLQSALDDETAVRTLSGGDLDEGDAYQFALCWFFLGDYDQTTEITRRLVRQNPSYAAPAVLQGLTYTAQKKYPEAEQTFLAVLQLFPNNETAVEGLAHAYYLDGNRRRAREVLDQTARFAFPAKARDRFEALKGLYDQ
jgi:tetratricopeptide (TPR) repeat protein